MARLNSEFAEQVIAELRRSKLDFEIEPTVEGITPDFVVTLPGGRNVIVEAKAWNATQVNLARAQRETQFFRQSLDTSDAVIVVPEVPAAYQSDEVVGLDRLGDWLAQRAATSPQGEPITLEEDKPIMFCAMPFDGEFDDVYFVAMRGAASENSLTARRVDQDEFNGNIVDRITDLIEASVVVVVDLSISRPNVMYEYGYASALRKPVVPICSTPLDELPFDVAQLNTIEYLPGGTYDLTPRLSKRVAAAAARR